MVLLKIFQSLPRYLGLHRNLNGTILRPRPLKFVRYYTVFVKNNQCLKFFKPNLNFCCHCRKLSSFRERFDFESTDFQNYLKDLKIKHEELTKMVHEKGNGQVSFENYNELSALVVKLKEIDVKRQEMDELSGLISGEKDQDMKDLADKERAKLLEQINSLKEEVFLLLVPNEASDQSDIILEVKAGIGGQEAMLFASDIFEMYDKYARYKDWDFQILDYDKSDVAGGIRKAVASVSGNDVFRYMKYEGGVHRVQRVPETEKKGRVHTSTAAVAILPQPSEVEINIDAKDLRIDTYRSSGKGGQHVNKTDSAVRITHIPTGTVAESQQDRSQIKNREIALKILKSRLYEAEISKQTSAVSSNRKLQIGTKGRSEKIRTYNENQSRISDHRLSINIHNYEEFMEGGEVLDDLIEVFLLEEKFERLKELIDKAATSKKALKS